MSTPQCTANHQSGRTYDVVIPQVGNSAYCNLNLFGEGGIVTFSFTNIILLLIVGFMCLNKQFKAICILYLSQ